jgi:hypothetical protein
VARGTSRHGVHAIAFSTVKSFRITAISTTFDAFTRLLRHLEANPDTLCSIDQLHNISKTGARPTVTFILNVSFRLGSSIPVFSVSSLLWAAASLRFHALEK